MIAAVTDGMATPGPFALHFDEGFLGIEVDPDHDEIQLSFDEVGPSALRYRDDVVRRDAADLYADILGLSSAWRWPLCNQQGYRDGFQIEFGPADSTITVQYIAAASRLEPRRVTPVTIE
jgi:hypothetical protein